MKNVKNILFIIVIIFSKSNTEFFVGKYVCKL